jgi:ribosomal protein S17E
MTDEELEKYEKDFDAVFKHAKQFMVTKWNYQSKKK